MALNARSDTFDILHTDLQMDLSSISSGTFQATATISMTPKMNAVTELPLDLLALVVDSIAILGPDTALSFTQAGELVTVSLGWPYILTDTVVLKIFYGGQPAIDGSGWGGFYMGGGIAYNLGVGFDADPHPYGRSTFPCFDNFVERSSYSFHIQTSANHKAQTNGYLTEVDTLTDGDLIWHYSCNGDFPSYLVGIAAGNYQFMESIHVHNGDSIPVVLAAKPADTTDMKNSFVNLDVAIDGFIESFGPYQWDKVGYVLTGQGAMEHPTNVAYPASIANGSLTYQNIIAHELAHHWWGDLVTCKTQEDMWINEGMAEFCSHLFFEHLNGHQNYLRKVKENHLSVLRGAHLQDGGYRAIYGIPHAYTYGAHVYNKGASVVHSLRGYLGDSLFFHGLTQLAQNNAWSALDTWEFRDELEAYTGMELDNFFDDWIFQPGFVDFGFDSLWLAPSGSPNEIVVRQEIREATHYFSDVPVELSFYDDNLNSFIKPIYVDGPSTSIVLGIGFDPVCAILDREGKLNRAGVFANDIYDSNETIDNNGLNGEFYISNISDSCLFNVEHHWIAPQHAHYPQWKFSNNHYWTVSGARLGGVDMSAQLNYTKNAGLGAHDADLVSLTEDSILLLYREHPQDHWMEYWHYTKNIQGSSSNGFGKMEVDILLPGQYCFANGISTIGLEENIENTLSIHPNPASSSVQVNGIEIGQSIRITNSVGELIYEGAYTGNVNIHQFVDGVYFIWIDEDCLEFIKQ
jgi:aminopeptidase N